MTGHASRRAMALILVLWTITILAMVAAGLSFAVKQDLLLSNIEKDRLVAHYLARAGLERAIAAIMDDDRSSDITDDLWYDDEDMADVELAGGTFSVIHGSDEPEPTKRYGVGDECAKLNLNVATKDQLMKLPEMTEEIAAAILDWRDGDEDPKPLGAERAYYDGLDHPYTIRNGQFRTVRELLLVRGVMPELFYGEDANLNGLLDANENDGETSEPMDNADGVLQRGWFAYVTIYSYEKNVTGSGGRRLNLNTATEDTLGSRLSLEKWAAKSIVTARQGKRDNKFTHLVDLLDVRRDSRAGNEDEADLNYRSNEEQNTPVTKAIFQRIVDELTLTDERVVAGRINVNTASMTVLMTLPEINEELASAIIRNREGFGGGYQSIGDLFNVVGITKDRFGKIENSVTVRSCTFRILSEGYASSGLAKATLESVVDRSEAVPRILYWLESSP